LVITICVWDHVTTALDKDRVTHFSGVVVLVPLYFVVDVLKGAEKKVLRTV
jgi:hypothetical protein